MLRRLSDVTLGSLDKIILKIGGKNDLKENKRKFKSGAEIENEESEWEEVHLLNNNCIVHCIKSKIHLLDDDE